jgi:hypothetical protein
MTVYQEEVLLEIVEEFKKAMKRRRDRGLTELPPYRRSANDKRLRAVALHEHPPVRERG